MNGHLADLDQAYHDPQDEPGSHPLKPSFFKFEVNKESFDREVLKRKRPLSVPDLGQTKPDVSGMIYAEVLKPIT